MNGNNGDSHRKGTQKNKIDTDYLDLLSMTDVTEEEIRRSEQSRAQQERRDSYEDVYSHSDGFVDDEPDSFEVRRPAQPRRQYEDVYSGDERYARQGSRPKQPARAQSTRPQQSARPQGARPQQPDEGYDYAPWKQPQRPAQQPSAPPVKRQVPSDERSDHEERRGKKKKHSVFGRLFVFLLVLIIALGGAGWFSLAGVVKNFESAKIEAHYDGELVSTGAVTNVLLIGLDKEKGGISRSDSIMICSVNKSTGKIVLTSVLRDTHLDIPGECEAKVNSAYARGGADLLIQTLEKSFGLKIDEYACVNFEMFTELVDGLGGIDVEVTEDEANYINYRHNYKGAKKPDFVESGDSVHLNGYQALWYSRIRYLDSDFMRTFRQRKVLTAIAGDVKSQLTPTGILGLIKTAKSVAPYVETTLSTADLLKLTAALAACLVKSGADIDKMLVSQKIPFDGTWDYANKWDGSSIVIDLDKNRQMLYSSVYEAADEEPTADGVD